MNKTINKIKGVVALFMLLIVAITNIHIAAADDGGNENELKNGKTYMQVSSQDYEKESGQEYERENDARDDDRKSKQNDGDMYEDDEDNWDFSNDFQAEIAKNNLTIDPVKNEVLVILEQEIKSVDVKTIELNESLYKDDDNDTVINKDDKYPGENDLVYMDSDGDGINDAEDKYQGRNDLDFQDIDNDGVKDSQDSDTRKKTDLDHDGIDDKYDSKDNRPIIIKLLSIFGFFR